MKTVAALFHTDAEAKQAVENLRGAGLPSEAVRVVLEPHALGKCLTGEDHDEGRWRVITAAVVLSAAMFGLAGVLAGFEDWLLGVTTLAATVGVVVAFVLMGALVGAFLGIFLAVKDCDCDTRLFADGMRQGGMVVLVQAAGGQTRQVFDILVRNNGASAKICGGEGY